MTKSRSNLFPRWMVLRLERWKPRDEYAYDILAGLLVLEVRP